MSLFYHQLQNANFILLPSYHLFAVLASKIKMLNGIPKMTNDGQAILSGVYQSLRTNRQQRRSFLSSVLRLFSEDCREVININFPNTLYLRGNFSTRFYFSSNQQLPHLRLNLVILGLAQNFSKIIAFFLLEDYPFCPKLISLCYRSFR